MHVFGRSHIITRYQIALSAQPGLIGNMNTIVTVISDDTSSHGQSYRPGHRPLSTSGGQGRRTFVAGCCSRAGCRLRASSSSRLLSSQDLSWTGSHFFTRPRHRKDDQRLRDRSLIGLSRQQFRPAVVGSSAARFVQMSLIGITTPRTSL